MADTVRKVLEIRVDHETAIKHMGEYVAEITSTIAAQKELKRQFKDGIVTEKEYAQQMAALNANLANQRDSYHKLEMSVRNKLKADKEQVGSLRGLRAELSNLTAKYDALDAISRKGAVGKQLLTQINAVTKSIKDAEMATQRFYRNVGNYKSAVEGFNQISTGFKRLASMASAAIGGFGLKNLGDTMLEVARNFEDGMARVNAVLNPTRYEFGLLTDKAMELGRTTRYTASEVANGMEELSRKGLSAKETMDAITPTLQLAQANVVSIADAAAVSASTMRAFGKSAVDLSHINDVLSSACAHSATNLTLIGEALKTAGPIAHGANINLEETVALIGSLANVGMTGSDAGTGIKQVVLALTTAFKSKKGLEALKKYGLEVDDARIKTEGLMGILKEMKASGLGNDIPTLKELVGKYAAPRLEQLIKTVEDAERLKETLTESYGENERMFNESIGKTSNAVYMLKSAWESFLIDTYESSSEYLIAPIEALTALIRGLGQQFSFFGQTVTTILATITFKPLITGMWSLFTSLSANFKATYAQMEQQRNAGGAKLLAALAKETEATAAAEQAKLRLIEAKEAAEYSIRNKFMTKRELEYAKLFNSEKKIIDEITLRYQKALRTRKAALQEYVNARRAMNAAVVAQEQARSNAVEALNEDSAKKSKVIFTGRLAFIQTGLTKIGLAVRSLFSMTKAMISSFAFTAIIAGIAEIAQGLYRVGKRMWDIKHVEDDIKDTMKKMATNDSITRLQHIKKQLTENHEIIKDSNATEQERNKAKKTEKELIEQANGLLGTNKKTYGEINGYLAEEIKHLKHSAKLQALKNTYAMAYQKIMAAQAKYEVEGENPREIVENLEAKFNDRAWWQRAWGQVTGFLGGENLSSTIDDMQLYIKQLDYVDKKLTSKQKNEALWSPGNPGDKIQEGESKGNDPWSDEKAAKKRADRMKDAYDKYLKLMKQYGDKENSLNADMADQMIDTRIAKINLEFSKIKSEFERFWADGSKDRSFLEEYLLGTDEDGVKYIDKLKAQMEKDVRLTEKKTQLLRSQAWTKEYNDRRKFEVSQQQKLVENLLQVDKNYFEERRKLLEMSTLSEQDDIEQQYFANKFGKSKAHDGTDEDKRAAYEEYRKRRNKLESDLKNGDINDEQYQAQLKAINKGYEAEAGYFNALLLLRGKYNLNSRKLQQEQAEYERQLLLQNMETQMNALKLAWDEIQNKSMDNYYQLEYGSAEYWERMKTRIGERQAQELQMQQQQADEEYRLLISRQLLMGETQEEYNAKVIAAQQKMESVHTATNNAIQQSDEARWQAAQTITGGLINLTEQLGEEDKGAAKLAKMLALAQIAISTGEAIAKMTAAEANKGVLGIGTTAAGIAEILSNIASAIATVKAAKFAKGAVNIGGAGTSTSDSIPARISKGESVINAKATKMFEPFLIAMNAFGNGVALPRNRTYVEPTQMETITEGFEKAAMNIKPVVSVREIADVQNHVEVIETLDTL